MSRTYSAYGCHDPSSGVVIQHHLGSRPGVPFLWRKRMGVSVGSRYSDTNYYKVVKDTKFDNEAERSKDPRTLNVQGLVDPTTKLGTAILTISKALCYHHLLAITLCPVYWCFH